MKAEIYQSLYAINESLQLVTEHLERLKLAEVFSEDFADIRRLATEQMRSEINRMATLRLHDRECERAYHFEQQRIRHEDSLRNPDPIHSRRPLQNPTLNETESRDQPAK